MKSLFAAVVIAAIMICGGIYATNRLGDVSEYLIEIAEQTETEIKVGNFKSAEELCKKSRECVEKNYDMFAVSVDHDEIDKIEQNQSSLTAYIEQQQTADSLAYNSVLKELYEHIPKDYRLNLGNVL